jgi:hypothetical protein
MIITLRTLADIIVILLLFSGPGYPSRLGENQLPCPRWAPVFFTMKRVSNHPLCGIRDDQSIPCLFLLAVIIRDFRAIGKVATHTAQAAPDGAAYVLHGNGFELHLVTAEQNIVGIEEHAEVHKPRPRKPCVTAFSERIVSP